MAFTPPAGNKTVMVDNNNNIVYPSSFKNVTTNSINIAGNNFSEVPNVISAETANVNQLPTVASVVNYVADVVEGGSSGVIPVIQNDIQLLGQFKSNDGALHCGDYYCWFGKSMANASSQSTANITKSVLLRIVDYDWHKHTTDSSITTLAQVGGYGGYNGFMLDYRGTSIKMLCSYYNNGSTYQLYTLFEVFYNTFSQFFKSSVNDFCAVFKTDADSLVVDARLYLNGNLIGSASNTGIAWYQNYDAFRFNGANNEAFTYKDVCVFNFDVSDANAPYTLSDYQQGKPIPVECLDTSAEQRALLALENYTLKVGSSQKVLDYSGNANDASTVYGTVKGDNDTRISAFVNAITGN